MSQRVCCCGCSHDYRVFVPCETTHASREIRFPVTHRDNLTACGLDEKSFYYFDAPDCEPYCGYWKCVVGADDPENQCYPDDLVLDPCPSCEAWDDLVDPPYEFVRPSDWTTAYCDRYTEIDNCCDELCPVDCGYGDVIPGDCATCYDPALLGWSVSLGWKQTTQASCYLVNAGDPCLPPVEIRYVSVQPQIVSVTPVINGTSLDLCVEIEWTWTKNSSDNDCNEVGDPFWECAPTCFPGDPGNDVIEQTWKTYEGRSVKIPCMSFASFGTVGCPPLSDSTTMCGGIFEFANNPGNVSASFQGFPIGWGGNALVYELVVEKTWSADVEGFCWPCSQFDPSQSGTGILSLFVQASLPQRPDPCV